MSHDVILALSIAPWGGQSWPQPPFRRLLHSRRLVAGDVLQRHLLPDALNPDPLRLSPRRAIKPFDRFLPRLAAQSESLMMHGQKHLSPRVVAHLPGLLRRAVITNPGVVCAHRHDRQIDAPRTSQRPKRRRGRRIATEQNPIASRL